MNQLNTLSLFRRRNAREELDGLAAHARFCAGRGDPTPSRDRASALRGLSGIAVFQVGLGFAVIAASVTGSAVLLLIGRGTDTLADQRKIISFEFSGTNYADRYRI